MLREDGKNSSPDIAVIEGDIDLSEIERAVNLRAVGMSRPTSRRTAHGAHAFAAARMCDRSATHRLSEL